MHWSVLCLIWQCLGIHYDSMHLTTNATSLTSSLQIQYLSERQGYFHIPPHCKFNFIQLQLQATSCNYIQLDIRCWFAQDHLKYYLVLEDICLVHWSTFLIKSLLTFLVFSYEAFNEVYSIGALQKGLNASSSTSTLSCWQANFTEEGSFAKKTINENSRPLIRHCPRGSSETPILPRVVEVYHL